MNAILLVRTRVVFSSTSFAELVLWEISKPLRGSTHFFKYRLAYVVAGECVLRFDNEDGKGDHRHWGASESTYRFLSPEKLMDDFQKDIARWNDENNHP
jgi:hypothetical protein